MIFFSWLLIWQRQYSSRVIIHTIRTLLVFLQQNNTEIDLQGSFQFKIFWLLCFCVFVCSIRWYFSSSEFINAITKFATLAGSFRLDWGLDCECTACCLQLGLTINILCVVRSGWKVIFIWFAFWGAKIGRFVRPIGTHSRRSREVIDLQTALWTVRVYKLWQCFLRWHSAWMRSVCQYYVYVWL